MAVISFVQKKREKEWKYERSILRELSVKKLRQSVSDTFRSKGPIYFLQSLKELEESTLDCAIEAYLLGASCSSNYIYKKNTDETKKRCNDQMEQIIIILKQYTEYYFAKNNLPAMGHMKINCDELIWYWWQEGYEAGVKRKKLRL